MKAWFLGNSENLALRLTSDEAQEVELIHRASEMGQPLSGGSTFEGSQEVSSLLGHLSTNRFDRQRK